MAGNGANNGNKILYLILSGQAALLLALTVAGLGVITDHTRTIRDLAIAHATMRAEMQEVKAVLTLTRTEQDERTKAFTDLAHRLLIAEQHLILLLRHAPAVPPAQGDLPQ